MVFSLMDLLGINLKRRAVPTRGKDEGNYQADTRGHEIARWEGHMAVYRTLGQAITEISTLPDMPETSESGRAYFSTSTGKVLATDAICAEERW